MKTQQLKSLSAEQGTRLAGVFKERVLPGVSVEDAPAWPLPGIGGDEQSHRPPLLSFSFNFITNVKQLDLIRPILCVLGHREDSKMYTAENVHVGLAERFALASVLEQASFVQMSP